MKRALILACIVMVALPATSMLIGCGGGEKEETVSRDKRGKRDVSRRRRSTAGGESSAASTAGALSTVEYSAGEVSDGKTLTVNVAWTGKADTPTSLSPMPTGGVDSTVCKHHAGGNEMTNERLLVDPATKGVANTLVFLSDISEGKAWPDRTPRIDQKSCVYTPEVSFVKVGGELDVASSDPVTHTVLFDRIGRDGRETVRNLNFPAGTTKVEKVNLAESAIYELKCEAGHNWMNALVFASNNPYVGVTDAKGNLQLSDVPEGEYTMQVVHVNWSFMTTPAPKGAPVYIYESMLKSSFKISVKGDAPTVKVGLSEDGFKKLD